MRLLSLGAGVQSTALLLLSESGVLEPFDYAIFADTGWEPAAVYEHLGRLQERCKTPIEVVRNGSIRDTGDGRRASLPFFTRNEHGKKGVALRQCTNEYKVLPIRRFIRTLLSQGEAATMAIGISTDEAHRAKPSAVKYISHVFPLLDRRLSRRDCIDVIEREGLKPVKSACIGCPYHSDKTWVRIKKESPAEFEDACKFDEEIRTKTGMSNEQYLHQSLKPLREVRLMHEDQAAFLYDEFGNECDGLCGT